MGSLLEDGTRYGEPGKQARLTKCAGMEVKKSFSKGRTHFKSYNITFKKIKFN